ncbi:MAG: cyclic pyranopterin monophosphate synthase MoaC [Acidobacteria bacterium]|nr:cyclic pyranopterin monophosphate synthase MoaC [Acidobacteriota bacterium]
MAAKDFTHLDEEGRATMVDIGDKPETQRTATASGKLRMRPETRARVLTGDVPKGNVVEVARIAGIQAAKRTAELIPLCHPLPLSHIDVQVEPCQDGLCVSASASCTGQTGVEMEALTAASVALLTLYDMCKALERGMEITDVRLESKSGGRSDWRRSG